jgi:ribose/xylose/arabinose/galactoside ABC-type transport system permease subunit
MAYEDGVLRARDTGSREITQPLVPRDQSRYQGEGFRIEPEYRSDPTAALAAQPVTGAPAGADPASGVSRRVATPNLDYVFDDPADGEPGPDRILVHGLWELVLALLVAGLGYLLYRGNASVFTGDSLQRLLLEASALGALAMGSALALRTGAVNLSIGTLAAAGGLYYGHNVADGLGKAILVVVGGCAAVGLVHGLAVVGLHVPGWAASLGVAMVVIVWAQHQAAVTISGGYAPERHVYYWFGGFCVLSVLGGLIGIVPSVRRAIGRFRPVADPAQRRGVVAALITLGATVGSAILAGLAGLLAAAQVGSAAPSDGLAVTALALGAALLGGTSAYGRRGGIFGTVFAVALVTLGLEYAAEHQWSWTPASFGAIAVLAGLLVTRLVERFGRPPRGNQDDGEWQAEPAEPAEPADWSQRNASWSSSGGLWSPDDAWGARS